MTEQVTVQTLSADPAEVAPTDELTEHQRALAEEADEIANAQAGDPAALEALIRRHQPTVLARLRKKTRSPEDAEDLAQETFLRMVSHLDQFENRGAGIAGWLQTVSSRLFYDRYKVEKGHRTASLENLPEYASDIPLTSTSQYSLEGQVVGKVYTESVLHALEHQLTHKRFVVIDGLAAGLTNAEIAKDNGMNRITIGSRLCKARDEIVDILHTDVLEPKDALAASANKRI